MFNTTFHLTSSYHFQFFISKFTFLLCFCGYSFLLTFAIDYSYTFCVQPFLFYLIIKILIYHCYTSLIYIQFKFINTFEQQFLISVLLLVCTFSLLVLVITFNSVEQFFLYLSCWHCFIYLYNKTLDTTIHIIVVIIGYSDNLKQKHLKTSQKLIYVLRNQKISEENKMVATLTNQTV